MTAGGGRDRQQLGLAYFLNGRVRGGAEEHVLTLLRGLDRDRFQPYLIAPPELCDQLAPDVPEGIELHRLRLSRPTHVGAMLELAGYLRARKVQVLHSHLFYASLFASPVGRLAGVPLIIETPHVSERWRTGWFKRRYMVDRLGGRSVDYYVAVSRANAEYLIREKRLASRKVVMIHNGSNLERFSPNPLAGAELRRRLKLPKESLVVSVVGRLEPQKGHGLFLDALPSVRKEFPAVQVFFLGEGSLRQKLQERILAEGMSSCVRLAGFQPDVVPWLAASDVFVLPSLFEGLPLVAIEALSMEKAVVATSVDGTPEVVLHGETGLVVPPGQAGPLAAAICEFLRDPERREVMGRNGRKHVLECFSEQRQLSLTQALYAWGWRKRTTPISEPTATPAVPELLKGRLHL